MQPNAIVGLWNIHNNKNNIVEKFEFLAFSLPFSSALSKSALRHNLVKIKSI